MSKAAALVVSVLVVGCGGSDAAAPDAPETEPPVFVPGPNRVTLAIDFSHPFYIRYRDGDGPWTEPRELADNTYELWVTDAYAVVALCGELRDFDSEMLERTFADGPDASMFCEVDGPTLQQPVAFPVRGTMQQPGDVFMEDHDSSDGAPWSFTLGVEPGTWDLIAASSDRIAIRRGIDVEDATTVAGIDLATEGAPLATQSFSAGALPEEALMAYTEVFTPGGFAYLAANGSTLRYIPAADLAATDFQQVSIEADGPQTLRRVVRDVAPDAAYSLPAPLSGIEFSFPYRQLWATWHDLPAHSELALALFSATAPTTQVVTASARYLAATGQTFVSFYPAPPDYDVRFTIDVIGPYYRYFMASDDTTPGVYQLSEYFEPVNFP